MEGATLAALMASLWERLGFRTAGSNAGSAARGVTLGEAARGSPDEVLQRLGSGAQGADHR